MHLTKETLAKEDRKKRLIIVNSITGIKPANLIGTTSEHGIPNVAIFSSVVHLGSHPALIGFIIRPSEEVPRNTYNNLKATGLYTINSVPASLAEKAHYTSAKFDPEVNEFERCNIQPYRIDDFNAPFVADSPIKIGLKMVDEIPIEHNETRLIIGSVEHIIIEDSIIEENNYINLEKGEVLGVGGLNSYYNLKKNIDLPYVRKEEVPDFDKD